MKHLAPASRRKTSIVFITCALAISFLAWGCMHLTAPSNNPIHQQVQVTDGDGQVHTLPLDKDGSYTFTTSLGTNTVEIANGRVRMQHSDCPGRDCVEQGFISDATEVIVCMPHKVIARIVEGEGDAA